MPPLIASALPIITRLPWRYIGPAIGAALALWAAYSWAWQRGHDSRDGEVAAISLERDAARANVGTLEAALVQQNAAIAAAADKTRAAQDAAADAARRAQERDRQLAGLRARLDAAARSGEPVAGCDVPDAVAEAWGSLR